jgi:hypothetical protein
MSFEFFWFGFWSGISPETIRSNLISTTPFKTVFTRLAGIALLYPIFIPSANRALGYFFTPPGREETLAAYRWIARRYRPGDIISLSFYALSSFNYYKAHAHWPSDRELEKSLVIEPPITTPAKIPQMITPFIGHPRVWLILIHTDNYGFDEVPLILEEMDKIGALKETHIERGAQVYLYDCSPNSATEP